MGHAVLPFRVHHRQRRGEVAGDVVVVRNDDINTSFCRGSYGPVTVPEGQYFIMGDSRDNSRDSRWFGFVPRRNIVGRAVGIAASFNIKDKYQPRLGRFFTDLK